MDPPQTPTKLNGISKIGNNNNINNTNNNNNNNVVVKPAENGYHEISITNGMSNKNEDTVTINGNVIGAATTVAGALGFTTKVGIFSLVKIISKFFFYYRKSVDSAE